MTDLEPSGSDFIPGAIPDSIHGRTEEMVRKDRMAQERVRQGREAVKEEGNYTQAVEDLELSVQRLAEVQSVSRFLQIFGEAGLSSDDILKTWPPGAVPDPEATTFRSCNEMEPYLKEPGSPGWKSVYTLPKIGPY